MTQDQHDWVTALDRYWDELAMDKNSRTLAADRGVMGAVHDLHRMDDTPPPDPGFVYHLWQHLTRESLPTRNVRGQRTWMRIWPERRQFLTVPQLAAVGLIAAVFLVAVVGLRGTVGIRPLSQPSTVNAYEILQRASLAAVNPSVTGLSSFASTQVMRSRENGHLESRTWFRAPDSWRHEVRPIDTPGRIPGSVQQVVVTDGQVVWNHEVGRNLVRILPRRLAGEDTYGIFDDWNNAIARLASCSDPLMKGEEVVAARPAYVLDLRPGACVGPSPDRPAGRHTMWVDKVTSFVLRTTISDPSGHDLTVVQDVTTITYDHTLAENLFTFTPPGGALVLDTRSSAPTPGGEAQPSQGSATPRVATEPILEP